MQYDYDTREEVIAALKRKEIYFKAAALLLFQLKKSETIQREIRNETD